MDFIKSLNSAFKDMQFDLWQLSIPVVFVVSGVVTFLAIFIACIYTSRSTRRSTVGKVKNDNENITSSSDSVDIKGDRKEGFVKPDSGSSLLGKSIGNASNEDISTNTKSDEKNHSDLSGPEWPTDLGKEGGCPFSVLTNKLKQEAESEIDPVEYCQHIPREIKRKQHKIVQEKVEKTMTEEDRARENDIQRQQLAEIFRLMETQEDKFGLQKIDDMQDQMKLYM